MKYVVIENRWGIEIPLIFPNIVIHDEMLPEGAKVISAGECKFTTYADIINVCCWGKSLSLNKKARFLEDQILIEKSINNY